MIVTDVGGSPPGRWSGTREEAARAVKQRSSVASASAPAWLPSVMPRDLEVLVEIKPFLIKLVSVMVFITARGRQTRHTVELCPLSMPPTLPHSREDHALSSG